MNTLTIIPPPMKFWVSSKALLASGVMQVCLLARFVTWLRKYTVILFVLFSPAHHTGCNCVQFHYPHGRADLGSPLASNVKQQGMPIAGLVV